MDGGGWWTGRVWWTRMVAGDGWEWLVVDEDSGRDKENTSVVSKPKLDRGVYIFYSFATFSVQLGQISLKK